MLVTRENLEKVVKHFSKPGKYGFDTETTGLMESDRLFSLILADEKQGFYCNFQEYREETNVPLLPREWLTRFNEVFGNVSSVFYAHNAKFDIRMLAKEGITIKGVIHCTEALARVQKNNHFKYSLDACAKRIKESKDTAVDEYINKHKLFTDIKIPGKKKSKRNKHFDRVPFSVISPYGEQDAVLTRKLGMHQEADFAGKCSKSWGVAENEKKLTPVCARIEQRGIKIDPVYTQKALDYELDLVAKATKSFEEYAGMPFVDSPKGIKAVYDSLGLEAPGFTAKGNPSFTKELLEASTSPLASKILDIREHYKRAGTYYSSFLYFADQENIIRANMRQGGTETGRMSYSDPNLQNVPKEDDPQDEQKPFLVRSCFIPRKNHCYVPIDYNQQEFRMMLDYAGELDLIREINAGKDVHQATAELVGCTRKAAKTINFGLLYGMGTPLLARALGVSIDEAATIKRQYFAKLPRVAQFLYAVSDKGRRCGSIFNWAGRRCHISDAEYAYILPNHLIQGGGADVIKFAMIQVDAYLSGKRSGIVAQVHDELLLEMHKDELDMIPGVKAIMENIYQPKNGLRLTCSVEHSWKSWGYKDKVAGLPSAA